MVDWKSTITQPRDLYAESFWAERIIYFVDRTLGANAQRRFTVSSEQQNSAFRSSQSRAYGEKLEWLHVPRLGGRFEGLFVSSNPAGFKQSLLYVDLAGNAHQIWEVNHVWASWAIPSRNGKYLAILAPTADSNLWMAENF